MTVKRFSEDGLALVTDELRRGERVKMLWMVVCDLGDAGAAVLCEGLLRQASVTELDLGGNSLTAEGAQALAKVLRVNTTLTKLYLYDNTIINHTGINTTGYGPSYIKVFNNSSGYLSFWWPRISYWNSFAVHVRDAGGSYVNRVQSISNSAEPSSSKKVQTNLETVWRSGNDGSGSGLDADTCDGQHLGTSADVTFNNIYANSWFRTYGEQGLYSQSYGQHFYPDSSGQYWDMDGPLRVRDGYEGTIKGHYGYWDAGGTGVLDAGSWWLNNGGTNNGTVLCIGGYASANAHSTNTGRKLLFGGADSDAQGNYYIGTNLENVGGNHNKLDLRWHTGIRMGAQTQYGGVRIFDSEDMGTLRWQFNGTSGYNFQYTWTHLSGFHGVYSSNNSFHLYPNNVTYGSCRIDGSRNGWYGIHFGSNMTLMMNNTECGFHREADGWYLYVSSKNLYVPGNITAYWSDRRLKKDIKPLGEGVGLETINALQPSSFAWNEKAEQVNENLFDGKEEVSLIAQEVQEILPDAVCENKSAGKDKEYLTINYDKITPYLIQAVKDLTKKVQELEEKLNGAA